MNFSAFFTIFIMETLGGVAFLRSFIHTEGYLKSMRRMIFAHKGILCSILEHFKIFEPHVQKSSFTCLLGHFKQPSISTYFYMRLVVHDKNKCSLMKQRLISGMLHTITTTMVSLLAE